MGAAPRRLRDFFIRRREVWTLTWKARLLLLAVVLGGGLLLARHAGDFLAVDDPVGSGYLVVEGWMPPYTYQRAAELWRTGRYRKVIAVGVIADDPAANGAPREYAAVGSLISSGIPADAIVEAMGAGIQRDRTYHSAMNLRRWLLQRSEASPSLDVLTLGPHARRSQLLFRKALGEGVKIGVIAVPDRQFDTAHWWRTSEGVRSVLGESIAYVYARLFFDPEELGCAGTHC